MKKYQKNKVNRGDILKQVVEESSFKIEEIVNRMNYTSRNTYYNHIRNPNLSLSILKRYGNVLHHDFSIEIEELAEFKLVEGEPSYLKLPSNMEDAVRQRDFYHRLYMELLEEIRSLKEESTDLKQRLDKYKK